jgi:hypothetical protein
VEQEPEEQPEQADDVVWRSTPDIPKVDGSFSTLDEPHDGQATDAPLRNISFSNVVRHLLQRNSKIGIAGRSQAGSYLGTSMADSGRLPPTRAACWTLPGPSRPSSH